MDTLQNRVAVVTAAGSGIGRHVALALVNDGFHVAIAGRTLANLEATAAAAGSSKNKVLCVATDVSAPESVQQLFEKTRDEFGRVDLLFNNAGINIPGSPVDPGCG